MNQIWLKATIETRQLPVGCQLLRWREATAIDLHFFKRYPGVSEGVYVFIGVARSNDSPPQTLQS
jgi:hypothetical protein